MKGPGTWPPGVEEKGWEETGSCGYGEERKGGRIQRERVSGGRILEMRWRAVIGRVDEMGKGRQRP